VGGVLLAGLALAVGAASPVRSDHSSWTKGSSTVSLDESLRWLPALPLSSIQRVPSLHTHSVPMRPLRKEIHPSQQSIMGPSLRRLLTKLRHLPPPVLHSISSNARGKKDDDTHLGMFTCTCQLHRRRRWSMGSTHHFVEICGPLEG
jgi:hypothetical protein